MSIYVGMGWDRWVAAAHAYAVGNGNRTERAAFYAGLGAWYAHQLAVAPFTLSGVSCDPENRDGLAARYRSTRADDRVRLTGDTLERANAAWDALGAEWHGWRGRCAVAAAEFRHYRIADAIGAEEWEPVRDVLAAWADACGGDRSPAYVLDRALSAVSHLTEPWRPCPGCRDLLHSDRDPVTWLGGDPYCEPCGDERSECDDCGEVSWSDEHRYSERTGLTLCRSCERERNGSWECYSHRPQWEYHRAENGNVIGHWEPTPGVAYYGAEIEADGGGDPDPVWALVEDGACFPKSDGSLSDGVEIVTHPMTLQAFRLWADRFPTDALTDAGWGADNAPTAGLHVHVSRSAFASRSHLARFGLLIHSGAVPVAVARRHDAGYAQHTNTRVVSRVARPNWHSGRYYAVNYATPDRRTVEVRAFAGTLRRDRLAAAVECCDAALHYTRNLGAADVLAGALTGDAFARWIANNDYPTLAAMVAAGTY